MVNHSIVGEEFLFGRAFVFDLALDLLNQLSGFTLHRFASDRSPEFQVV